MKLKKVNPKYCSKTGRKLLFHYCRSCNRFHWPYRVVTDTLLQSIPAEAFPSKPDPDDICLTCRIAKRRRFSWFCSNECEVAFVSDYIQSIG